MSQIANNQVEGSQTLEVSHLLAALQQSYQCMSNLHPEWVNDCGHDSDNCPICETIGSTKGVLLIHGVRI